MQSNSNHELPMASGACCCTLNAGLRLPQAEADVLADRFKAIGHPIRLQIVDLLSRFGGEVCVCDVEAHFSLSQPTISHHLRVLRRAGLIEAEQRGLWIYYVTAPAALATLQDFLAALEGQPTSVT